MDAFDLKILDALQVDGRLSNQELAERVGLSASQCSRRRSALESDGAIEGYHASLSAKALGLMYWPSCRSGSPRTRRATACASRN